MTLKNSNGAQNTLKLAEGQKAAKVEFYATTNNDAGYGKLSEFNGESCSDEVSSIKDYTNPSLITKTLATPANEFTFTFSSKQVCFIAVVTLADEGTVTEVEKLQWDNQPSLADKIIRNGQMVIIRDGVEYSVLGARMQ